MPAHATEKRPIGALGRMGVISAMHVALILVLANSFGLMPKLQKPDAIEGTVIDEPPPDEAPPPIDHYVPPDPNIYVPAPEGPPAEADDGGGISAVVLPPGGIVVPPPYVPAPIPETGVRTDPRRPLTQPRYP